MSDKKEKDEKKLPTFKIISSETSVPIPTNQKKDTSQNVFDTFLENLQIQPKKKQSSTPISKVKTPSIPSNSPTEDLEPASDNKVDETGMSEDLLKTMRMLEDIKQEELAAEAASTLKEDIPLEIDETLLKRITCPFCNRSIPLRKLEFLSQGYSDYCPQCNQMILPDQVKDQL